MLFAFLISAAVIAVLTNAALPIAVTPDKNDASERLVQFANANALIVATPSALIISSKDAHPSKAYEDIVLTVAMTALQTQI